MGRKSKATLAAEAAAEAKTQELAKVEVVDGEKVVTDLEPESKPVDPETEIKAVLEGSENASVDPNGEDLGDVSSEPAKTPEIASGEAVDPTEGVVDGEVPSEAPELEQDRPETPEEAAVTQAIYAAIEFEEGFKPILRPTMVGDAYTGHIPCPKAVFDLVQTEGWQDLIEVHPAKHGLKSVLYWKNINGSAVVRCMSSSRFADVV